VAQLFSLGDFAFMKTYRILGILWLALCCYICFEELWALLNFHPVRYSIAIACSVRGFFIFVYLAGIVASLFLFRGARWARWMIISIAIFTALCTFVIIAASRSLPVWTACVSAFALLSVVLLFLPRHEPVA
jgi:hypothetical protein